MADRTFKPKSGEEIIITVPRGKKKPTSPIGGTARRKGIIKTRKPDDYLPRRIAPGGIEIFDTSYYFNGSNWQRLFYQEVGETLEAAHYIDLYNTAKALGLERMKNLSELIAEFADLYASAGFFPRLTTQQLILGDAVGDNIGIFGTTFERYPFDSLRDPGHANFNTQWKSTGLKLTPAQLAEPDFYVSSFFGNLKLKGAGKNKITSVLNFEAPAVEFTPGNKMSIYLLPEIILISGSSTYLYNDGNTEVTTYGTNWRTVRFPQPIYNRDNLYFRYNDFFTTAWQRNHNVYGGNDFYHRVYKFVNFHTYNGISSNALLSNADAFPAPPASPYDNANGENDAVSLFMFNSTPGTSNHLAAVIKQNDTFFYVWTN